MNILFPMNKRVDYFIQEHSSFPLYLYEIQGVPILERVIKNYADMDEKSHSIFLLNKEDCMKYYTDDITKLLTNRQCTNIILDNETKGSVCTCLMAIDHINTDDELLIVNSDQIFELKLVEYVQKFRRDQVDAATLYFDSVHPRWSFVRLDGDNNIIESSEKKPISKNAVAGIFYFRHGRDYVNAAMKTIKRGVSVNGSYYNSQVLNEFILENYRLKAYKIAETNGYFTLYSPEKLAEYKKYIEGIK